MLHMMSSFTVSCSRRISGLRDRLGTRTGECSVRPYRGLHTTSRASTKERVCGVAQRTVTRKLGCSRMNWKVIHSVSFKVVPGSRLTWE